MNILLLILSCVVLSIIITRFSIYLASIFSLADHPDDDIHKNHDISTPFVGGIGVFAALSLGLVAVIDIQSVLFHKYLALGLCSIIIFICGFTDDIINLSYKPRFIIQTIVGLIMVLAGEVVLIEFGELLPGSFLQLGLLAVPITVFGIIGGINALNMIDGIDGLSGSLSLVSLVLISIVAFVAGDQHNLILATALIGGLVGFLYFNLRYHNQRYARVFLGDNGSMLLGFMFAWLLVDISQGPNPAMTPVTAIWLFSIPLMDVLNVMLRRLWLGKSPFKPDRQHLHHLLQRAGLGVSEIVFVIVTLHLLLGIIGLMGLYLSVPEYVMFLGFILIFIGYLYLTIRLDRFVPLLRKLHILLNTRLFFAPVATCGTFSGSYSTEVTENLTNMVSEALGDSVNFKIKIFKQPIAYRNPGKYYAIKLDFWPIVKPEAKENITKEALKKHEVSIKYHLNELGLQLRQLNRRSTDSDPKAYRAGNAFGESNVVCRRKPGLQRLEFEILRIE